LQQRTRAIPFRQIHLDFHTGPAIRDVGRDFDAERFAATMKRSHVTSVTVFAKCHHGHLYFDTKHPARHPGLKSGLDLLGEQIDALHRQGINAPIYISVQCDEFAANTHPEWIARAPDGKTVGGYPTQSPYPQGQWQILDLSTPYQEYLVAQTAEVLAKFKPVDGIFFDMCWDQPSVNQHFLAAMRAEGLNPDSPTDRAEQARRLAQQYMTRLHAQVKASSPNAGVYFNSRPLSRLRQDIQFQAQVEIEALPTGGWGYTYFPRNVRYVRTFDKPYLGMTARFHKSWADFGGLKPAAALEYETGQMLAHGARCSIGDQLHPRGTLDRAAYELIEPIYQRVAARDEYVIGSKAVVDIGVFQASEAAHNLGIGVSGVDTGVTRLLTHLKAQFNVIDAESDLRPYRLLILPDQVAIDAGLATRLSAFVRKGGALLLSGMSGLSADGSAPALPEMGIRPVGPSPFKTTYLRFGKAIATGVPPTDHVLYDRTIRVTPAPGAAAVARIVEPYFERTWEHFSSHAQVPGDRLSRYAGATLNRRVAYIAFPVFSSYATHGNFPYRLLVGNLIDRLLPDPILRVTAPVETEVSVMRQDDPLRTIVHLLHYSPQRRTNDLDIVEDVIPLHDIPLSLKLNRKPSRVYTAPEREDVPFTYAQGHVNLVVPNVELFPKAVDGHDISSGLSFSVDVRDAVDQVL
jgi:hypothetical protein